MSDSSGLQQHDQTTASVKTHPDVITKAAALLQSIVNNHALVDGNKRLAWPPPCSWNSTASELHGIE